MAGRKRRSRSGRAPAAESGGGIVGAATRTARVLFLVAVVLGVLLNGAVETWPLTVVAILVALSALLAVAVRGEPPAARSVFRAALAAAALLAAVVLLQSLRFAGNPLAHPVWGEAEALLGPLPSAVSVAPAATRFALLFALTPFAAFIGALALHEEEAAALRLLSALGWIAGVSAVGAVAQEVVAPDRLMFAAKTDYVGSLTAPFVNRNTAATFYGIGALVLAGLFAADRRRRRERGDDVRARPRPLDRLRGPLRAVFLVATLVALMMTDSRGGIAAAGVGFLVLLPILVTRPRHVGEEAEPVPLRRRLKPLLAVLAVPLVVLVYAGGAGQRLAEAGLDDQRFCMLPALFATAADTPVLGAGFGAFSDVFAAFRDPACGIWGVWYRAHDGYLEAAIGLGLPAALLVVLAVGLLARDLARGVGARATRRYAPAVGLAALALAATHAVVDFSVQIPGVAIYLAAVLAAAITVGRARGT